MSYLKIACERCGGHIEYPSEMAGQSIQCPHCQHAITLSSPPPPQRTPGPPPVPNFAPPSPSRQFPTHPLKTVGCIGCIGSIVAIGIVALVVWFAYNSSK